MPSAATVPLLFLIVTLWRLTRGNVLAIVAFTSIFDAASALNFGHTGVPPWIFALVVCLAVKVVQGHRRVNISVGVRRVPLCLISVFIGYAILSSIFFPYIFRGLMVERETISVPLVLGQTNLTQACYLAAVSVVFLLAVTRSAQELRIAVDWYVKACVFAAGIGVYQLANAILHIPYPSNVLYSNPGHIIYPAYQINGMWRINSTFPEASEMAGYLAVAIAITGWRLMNGRIKPGTFFFFTFLTLSLLMTFSSTGYLTLVCFAAISLSIQAYRIVANGGSSQSRFVIALILVGMCFGLLVSGPATSFIEKTLDSTLFEKSSSDSYRARNETHITALQTARETYYIGVGWGTLRPSGLFYVLLGNLGLFGVLTFCCFCLSLYKPIFGRYRFSPEHELVLSSLFGITLMLIAMLVAGAEPVAPVLWMLFGIASTESPCEQRRKALSHYPQDFIQVAG